MPLKKSYTMAEIRRGLRKVRTKLLNGKISDESFNIHTCGKNLYDHGTDGLSVPTVCGTAACIGGWLAHELGVKKISSFTTAMDRFVVAEDKTRGDDAIGHGPLGKMFYDYGSSKTPKQGAKAIERYLEGKAPWTKRQREAA